MDQDQQDRSRRSASPLGSPSDGANIPEAPKNAPQFSESSPQHTPLVVVDSFRPGIPMALKMAFYSLIVLGVLYGLAMASNSYEFVKALNQVVGIVGVCATVTMGIGLAQVSWLGFKRSVSDGQTGPMILPVKADFKAGIALILVGAPLVLLQGLGFLLILAGIIVLTVFAHNNIITKNTSNVPGPWKYIVTILLILIGGISAALASLIVYIIVDTRVCELSGSSKCY